MHYTDDNLIYIFNEVVANIGTFGKYNRKKLLLLWLLLATNGMTVFMFIFTAGDTEYRCKVSECEHQNDTNWTHYAIPQTINGKLDKCSRFATNDHNAQEVEVCSREWFDNNSIVSCDEYIYGEENTISKQFNLGCQEWKRTLVGTVRGVAIFISLLICGALADRYGRKRILIIYSILIGLLGLIRSYSPNYETFIVLEFFDGMVSGGGLLICVQTLMMETVTPKGRLLTQYVLSTSMFISSPLTALVAWAFKDWRMILRVLQTPIILMVSYIWLIDESVRWLINIGKREKAMEILRKAVRYNFKKGALPESLKSFYNEVDNEISAEAWQNLKYSMHSEKELLNKIPPIELQAEQNSKEVSLKEVLRSPKLRFRLLMLATTWICSLLLVNGLKIYCMQYLPGNKYWNFVYLDIADPFVQMMSSIAILRFGRRKSMACMFILNTLCCFAVIAIPKTWTTVIIFLFMMCKYALKTCGSSLCPYTGEMFPTNLRSTLMGAGYTVGNIGFIIATQVPLLASYWESLPVIIFGITSLSVTLTLIPLPETVNVKLPDTIKEAEDM